MQFIKNAQRTQHENAKIPVISFALNDYSEDEPTEFEFIYTLDGIKYCIPLLQRRKRYIKNIYTTPPKGQKAVSFKRENQSFILQKKMQRES